MRIRILLKAYGKCFLSLLLLFNLWITPLWGAKTPPIANSLPKLLQQVESQYKQAGTLSANFVQTQKSATFSKPRVSQGKVFVKHPSLFRWETEKPDPNLIITNQTEALFYTPPFEPGEEGQLIQRKASEVQSQLINALLSGGFSMSPGMKIEEQDLTHFILTPKKGTAATVKTAVIEVEPQKKLIQGITLNHFGGNVSEIRFSQIKIGQPLKDDLFHFTPPPNTVRPDL